MVSTGKLDFSLAIKVLETKGALLFCLLLIVGQGILASIRWKILLRCGTNNPLPLKSLIGITWIGLFFSSFLPGAVTGDLIKLVYVRDLDKEISKTFLVMTVLLDRILGLVALFLLLGLFSIIYYSELSSFSKQLATLIHINFLIFIGVIFFLVTLFLNTTWQEKILLLIVQVPILGKRIAKTFEQFWIIGESKSGVFKCLLISVISHCMIIIAFYIISSPFYDSPISLGHAFTFMPLGLLAISIPIAPAGMGVGHAVFDTLFGYYNVSGGASLFNLYFLAYVFINMLGIFPYIFMGKNTSVRLNIMKPQL